MVATEGVPPQAIQACDQEKFCGDERTRTADPLLAKQVLYQLSYVPIISGPGPGI